MSASTSSDLNIVTGTKRFRAAADVLSELIDAMGKGHVHRAVEKLAVFETAFREAKQHLRAEHHRRKDRASKQKDA